MLINNIIAAFTHRSVGKLLLIAFVIGIITGIVSLPVAILLNIETNGQTDKLLFSSADNLVSLSLHDNGMEIQPGFSGITVKLTELPVRLKQNILSLGSVHKVSFIRNREYAGNVTYKDRTVSSCSITGIDKDYMDAAGYRLKSGREFYENEYEYSSRVCILSESAVSLIFKEDECLDKSICINDIPFTVVGVAEKSKKSKPEINSLDDYYVFADTAVGALLVPSSSWSTVWGYDAPQQILIKANSPGEMLSAGMQTEKLLNNYLESENSDENNLSYEMTGVMSYIKEIHDKIAPLSYALVWVVIISMVLVIICVTGIIAVRKVKQ